MRDQRILFYSRIRDADGNYVLHLLPALPSTWPNGSVKGLRARCGYEVDLAWKDGRLTSSSVRSDIQKSAQIKHGEKIYELDLASKSLRTRP